MPDTLPQDGPPVPDLSHLVTEDDRPVDNRFSERQQKLLTNVLFDSWEEGKPFEALVDVGLFSKPDNASVVSPDFLLALEVEPRKVSGAKEDRSYYTWVYGKPPNLIVEIVSNKEGGELDHKLETYQRIGVSYYAVFDRFGHLGQRELRLFQLVGGRYVEKADPYQMPELGLNFVLWEGAFYDVEDRWLRFTDARRELLLTGGERAKLAEEQTRQAEEQKRQAEEETRQAEEQKRHAEEQAREAEERLRQAQEKARRMEERLRELGVEPEG